MLQKKAGCSKLYDQLLSRAMRRQWNVNNFCHIIRFAPKCFMVRNQYPPYQAELLGINIWVCLCVLDNLP